MQWALGSGWLINDGNRGEAWLHFVSFRYSHWAQPLALTVFGTNWGLLFHETSTISANEVFRLSKRCLITVGPSRSQRSNSYVSLWFENPFNF